MKNMWKHYSSHFEVLMKSGLTGRAANVRKYLLTCLLLGGDEAREECKQETEPVDEKDDC